MTFMSSSMLHWLQRPFACSNCSPPESSLGMQKYYRIVKDSFGVLPAFASDIYYTKKASSSVATALICGTPLIADQKMLSSYPYLVKVCFLQQHISHQASFAIIKHATLQITAP